MRYPTLSGQISNRLARAVHCWEAGGIDFDDFRAEIVELSEMVKSRHAGLLHAPWFELLPDSVREEALFILDTADAFAECCWDILDGDPVEALNQALELLEVLEDSRFAESGLVAA